MISTTTTTTHTPMATTHVAHTRHVPRCLPHPCPCTTNILKHRHMLQTHDIRHPRLNHKACTKALASSMPMQNWSNRIKYITENSSPLMHETKATTHVAYTRHVLRHIPHPCPCTTGFNKIEYIR